MQAGGGAAAEDVVHAGGGAAAEGGCRLQRTSSTLALLSDDKGEVKPLSSRSLKLGLVKPDL